MTTNNEQKRAFMNCLLPCRDMSVGFTKQHFMIVTIRSKDRIQLMITQEKLTIKSWYLQESPFVLIVSMDVCMVNVKGACQFKGVIFQHVNIPSLSQKNNFLTDNHDVTLQTCQPFHNLFPRPHPHHAERKKMTTQNLIQ